MLEQLHGRLAGSQQSSPRCASKGAGNVLVNSLGRILVTDENLGCANNSSGKSVSLASDVFLPFTTSGLGCMKLAGSAVALLFIPPSQFVLVLCFYFSGGGGAGFLCEIRLFPSWGKLKSRLLTVRPGFPGVSLHIPGIWAALECFRLAPCRSRGNPARCQEPGGFLLLLGSLWGWRVVLLRRHCTCCCGKHRCHCRTRCSKPAFASFCTCRR